jgi:ribonuclease T1
MTIMRWLPMMMAMSCLDVAVPATRPPTPIAQVAGDEPSVGLLLNDVAVDEREAVQRVVVLIDNDGPFPHRQDGSVFQNRERQLPLKPIGFWHEYTVPTPGSADRGARRIVSGDDDSLHYTNNHYRSFVTIRMPR